MATKGQEKLDIADFSKMTITDPGMSTLSISSVSRQLCGMRAKKVLTPTSF